MLGSRIVLGLGPLAACVALFSLSSCSGAEFTGGGTAGKSNTAGSASGGSGNGGDGSCTSP